MTQTHTPIRLLTTHREADVAVLVLAKVNLSVIRLLRRYTKQYHFDLTYSPGSSGLSNVLMATLGLGTKNVAYRGTGARVRRTDPTYYLGILNPRV